MYKFITHSSRYAKLAKELEADVISYTFRMNDMAKVWGKARMTVFSPLTGESITEVVEGYVRIESTYKPLNKEQYLQHAITMLGFINRFTHFEHKLARKDSKYLKGIIETTGDWMEYRSGKPVVTAPEKDPILYDGKPVLGLEVARVYPWSLYSSVTRQSSSLRAIGNHWASIVNSYKTKANTEELNISLSCWVTRRKKLVKRLDNRKQVGYTVGTGAVKEDLLRPPSLESKTSFTNHLTTRTPSVIIEEQVENTLRSKAF